MALRRYYGVGAAKNFPRKVFYEQVLALATGTEMDDETLALIAGAAEYELEGIALSKEKNGAKGEPKPTLEKDIAKEIIAGLVPLLGTEPMTTDELITLATNKGIMRPNGKAFSNPWVNTVFKALMEEGKITRKDKIVTVSKTKDGHTLNIQEPKIAYVRNPA